MLSAAGLLLANQSQLPQASAQAFPSYNIVITVLDFRESDHTANMSIHFNANFEMKAGELGLFGLDLTNTWDGIMGDYVHQEKNGTLLDETIGSWVFNFHVRAHAFGRTEFYPYDSWMFNLTLSTPLLSDVNSTNLHGTMNPLAVPGWTLRQVSWGGADIFRIVRGSYANWNSVVVTFVLDRAVWQTVSVRGIPIILMLILGISTLIPPKDLSSKATVYTSIIFFIAAFLFQIGDYTSAYKYALSFGEVVFYYLLLAASIYLMLAVLENVLIVKDGVFFLGKTEKARRFADTLRVLIFVLLLGFVWIVPLLYSMSYVNTASSYWWVRVPLCETWFFPGLLASSGIVANLMALCGGLKRGSKQVEDPQVGLYE
jgi:hypothetical protein